MSVRSTLSLAGSSIKEQSLSLAILKIKKKPLSQKNLFIVGVSSENVQLSVDERMFPSVDIIVTGRIDYCWTLRRSITRSQITFTCKNWNDKNKHSALKQIKSVKYEDKITGSMGVSFVVVVDIVEVSDVVVLVFLF